MADATFDVVVQIAGEDQLAGRMWSHRGRGSESATFRYDDAYLALPGAYAPDPALTLDGARHQTALGRATFGAFSDSAPDRWGRRLIQRGERRRVAHDGGAERSFGEIDYLLRVRDDLRQGALRFRAPDSGVFLADEHDGVPALVDLPKLLTAAERLERDEETDDQLRTLLRGGGSSLGGARPKAHVRLGDGRLAIAKFPSPADDDWDVMRWEAVALELARAAGITVPPWQLHAIDGRAVVISERFDRRGGLRIGYASAMTMLEASDGDVASYLDVADAIERDAVAAGDDLRELWRRIAFSVLISNTDDHLRNHGFLRTSSAGWSLSPAFDLNPDPRPGPKQLSTAIDFDNADASVELLLGVAREFRLTDETARAVLGAVVEATDRWRQAAERAGLDRGAQQQMAGAFEHGERERARRLAG